MIELFASDLPAFCPNPNMPLWSSHPRVFLDVVHESEAMCPYCGTRYRLRPGARVHDHGVGALNLHQDRETGVPASDVVATVADSVSREETANQKTDALGNTTLEQITRWLKTR